MDICDYLRDHRRVELSEQQAQAVNAPDGKTLLLAVPGAGKTTVVTTRVARLLLEARADPAGLLILTYNRAAAADMEKRWNGLFGELGLPQPRFSTIHSFCYRLLGVYSRMRDSAMPRLIEGDSGGGKGRIVSGLYREMTGQFLPDDQLGKLLNLMGYTVNLQRKPEEVKTAEAAELDFFPEMFRRYTTWKRENAAMDFDDMLLFAYTALTRSSQLRETTIPQCGHLLVDEAQDTSKLQQEIIALLTRDNLFMVGDEDQSIYGFRGAYPQGLLSFFQRYQDGALLKLEQNYRSTPEIVAASRSLIDSNTQRFAKAIFTGRPSGTAVRVVADLPMERQYRTIAEQAVEAAKTGTVAVLYRTSFSGIGVATELADLGADYSASPSRLGYSQDFVTRDICNILRLAQNPGDQQAFRQVYYRLGCSLPREIERQAAAEPRTDILDWIIHSAELGERSTGKLQFVRRTLQKMAKRTPLRQIDDSLEELSYLDSLEKRGPSGYLMSGYVQRLVIIRRFAQGCSHIEELLERLADAEKLLDSRGRHAIRLSTVHSAKGQEYDQVIVADALEGIFPDAGAVEYSALDSREPMEEETRLFYTAMTRARNELTLYAPAEGLDRELLPSRFRRMAGLGAAAGLTGDAREGLDISHTFFGAGTVQEVNRERRLVTVEFRHYGRKSFSLESLDDPKLFKLFQ